MCTAQTGSRASLICQMMWEFSDPSKDESNFESMLNPSHQKLSISRSFVKENQTFQWVVGCNFTTEFILTHYYPSMNCFILICWAKCSLQSYISSSQVKLGQIHSQSTLNRFVKKCFKGNNRRECFKKDFKKMMDIKTRDKKKKQNKYITHSSEILCVFDVLRALRVQMMHATMNSARSVLCA